MENFKGFQELFYYFVFLLIVIIGLGKWIIDLMEVIKELRIKNSRLNYTLNLDAKEYNQLQKEFSESLETNEKLRVLIETQEKLIKDSIKNN